MTEADRTNVQIGRPAPYTNLPSADFLGGLPDLPPGSAGSYPCGRGITLTSRKILSGGCVSARPLWGEPVRLRCSARCLPAVISVTRESRPVTPDFGVRLGSQDDL